jgi:uncharacterized membrane protein
MSTIAKHRLEALSDGVYAIALTLLVLELKLPALPHGASDAALRAALLQLLPKGFAWLLSFWVIAMFWLAQQRLFRVCQALDGNMVRLELLQLCLISLFPFSNALMGEYGGQVTPAAIYAGHLLAIALVSWARTLYFARHPELHTADMSGQLTRVSLRRGALVAACALAALLLAFVVPTLNMLAMLPTVFLSRLGKV